MDENNTTTTTQTGETDSGAGTQTASGTGSAPAAKPAAEGGTQQQPAAGAAGKTYTEAQLDEFKAQWKQEYEQSLAAEKDFEKMTPTQKAQKLLDDANAETARLQAQLADRDLTDYARGKITEAKLPAEAITFVKGKDQADTDVKIKAFSTMLAAGIQDGVEKRFKLNGYTPRGTSATNSGDGGEKKPRGVTINPGK